MSRYRQEEEDVQLSHVRCLQLDPRPPDIFRVPLEGRIRDCNVSESHGFKRVLHDRPQNGVDVARLACINGLLSVHGSPWTKSASALRLAARVTGLN